MNTEQRLEVERKIVTRIIENALKRGYSITLFNGGDDPEITDATSKDAILENMFATDQEHLFFKVASTAHSDAVGSVGFVYGNDGFDVINDYVVNHHTEIILSGIVEYICQLEKEHEHV